VQKHPNARVFAFGIGNGVNRFLLDSMAKYGRGEVEYVGLNDDGSAAARRFHERVRNPLLTDISVDWNGMPVSDVYPKTIPDLFSAKPVILTGRYLGNGRGVIRLKGKMSGRDFVREVSVDFSSTEQHDVLATLWARTRVDDLMSQNFNGAQQGTMKDDVKQAIVQLGLDYRLMTQFTSFVAVEEMIVTDGGQPRRIDVPVEVPEGVNREAVFGGEYGANISSRQIQNLPSNGRGVSNLSSLSVGTVSETVTVQSSSDTVINTQSATDVVTVYKATPEPKYSSRNPKPSKPKPAPGVGAGGGGGGGSGNVVINGADNEAFRNLSPDGQKRVRQQAVFHPALLAVIDRLKDPKQAPAADEAKFIRGGKAEIQIWLSDKSEETLAKLKELGFEVVLDPKSAKLVIGRLQIDKLAALSELKFVRYVAPQMSQ
jgi:Ca-activated chloride channel homolog